MTETTRACIRGCTLYRRHLAECDGTAPSIPPGRECRGCLPRRAETGLFCATCWRRFELMLTDAPTVYRWLTGNIGAGEGQSMDEIGQGKVKQKHAGNETPAPIKVAVFDVRQLLADRLAIWVDHHCEDSGVKGPMTHTVDADAAHLLRWLNALSWWDVVADWWEELAECFTDAHALAPWRPVMRRVPGVPCPECSETNLAIFGGESDVTCLSCRTLIREVHFGLWEQILEDERAAG